MSNHLISYRLTSNYLPDTIRSFDIERFDIEQRSDREGRADEMDAVTSFELEAQRRRETVASDRDGVRAQAKAWTAAVDNAVDRRLARTTRGAKQMATHGDCQPAPLARNPIG